MGFYENIYNRLYRHGYHKQPNKTHSRHLSNWMVENIEFESVLDIGCANGWGVEYFSKNGKEATGIDVSKRAISVSQSLGRNCIYGNAVSLPFEDKSFDAIMSTDVFEHLRMQDVYIAIDECHRVARRYISMKISTGYSQGVSGPKAKRGPYFRAKLQNVISNLHLTIKSTEWWIDKFMKDGSKIAYRNNKEFIIDIGDA